MSLSKLLRPRICELGKIKIGRKEDTVRTTKAGVKWRAPEKLDHFIITTMNRDASGDLVQDVPLMQSLVERFGDEDGYLRKIPITLLSDDIEDCIQAGYVWYNGKRVAARSDGETLTSFVDTKTGEILPQPRVSQWKDEYLDLQARNGAKLFKKHIVLSCVIISGESRWGGVYKFRTTSDISGDQLYGSLLHLSQLTGGVLRGLPLMLVVRPVQVAPEGKPTTVYVVHVELYGPDLQAIQEKALALAQFKLQHAKAMRHTQNEFRKLLRAPGDEDTIVEVADVEEEFHPQNFEEVDAGTTSLGDRLKQQLMGEMIDESVTAEPVTAEPKPATLSDALKLLRDGDIDGALALELGEEDAEALVVAAASFQGGGEERLGE